MRVQITGDTRGASSSTLPSRAVIGISIFWPVFACLRVISPSWQADQGKARISPCRWAVLIASM
ncbi:MAG: hypothetical protein R3D03_24230 [Geminicoccaceae bacterium]